MHEVIYHELCLGEINPASRRRYGEIMQQLVAQGAEAIILGCTEITLLVDATDASVPLTRHTQQNMALCAPVIGDIAW